MKKAATIKISYFPLNVVFHIVGVENIRNRNNNKSNEFEMKMIKKNTK